MTSQGDPLTISSSFNSSSTVEEPMLTDLRANRLAAESDSRISEFPTVASCLNNIQLTPCEFNNDLQVMAENIDLWRANLVTWIKLYNTTITDLQSSSNATSHTCDLNARTNSAILNRLDHLTEQLNHLEQCTSSNRTYFLSLRTLIEQLCITSDTQFSSLRDQLQGLSESPSMAPAPISTVDVAEGEHTVVVEGLRGLEQIIVTERNVVMGLRDMVVDFSERVDSSLSTALTSQSASEPVLGDRLNSNRERDVVCKGIERSEKLILQLISTKIPSDYVDIALIRKCNTIDLPALQSASKTCEKSLLKYLSFPGIDNSYCDRISELLDSAESWSSQILQAYTNAEVHSIKGFPGDVDDVDVFSNNANKTIFEFLESFELGYIERGNNRQRANKLLKHLSADLKDKLMTRSDNYALMREWLV